MRGGAASTLVQFGKGDAQLAQQRVALRSELVQRQSMLYFSLHGTARVDRNRQIFRMKQWTRAGNRLLC